MSVPTDDRLYEEQRSRDKLMSGGGEHGVSDCDSGDPNHMRMSSLPYRQRTPLSQHPCYDLTLKEDNMKTFQPGNNAYPTYPRATNHVYESPQFS